MKKNDTNRELRILFGLTFVSPAAYSIAVHEMDVVQRMFFFSTSLLLFLVSVRKIKIENDVQLNKPLLILMIIYPFTFLTCFFNNSSSLLPLQLSNLIIPLSIMIQSVLLFVILGEEKFLKVVSYSVVSVSTMFSIVGLFEVFQISVLDLPTVVGPGSTLGNRSFAAEYLLSSLPFFLILNEYATKKGKTYLLFAAVTSISFLLFTRNRSGIFILSAIVFFYIVFILLKKVKGSRFKSIKPILTILSISFLISFVPVEGSERPDIESTANSIFDSEFKSNVLRLSFWDASIQMINENPIAGIGLFKWSGTYPKYNGEYFNDENVTHIHSIHAHNDFLEIFAESGIAAPLVFLSIYLLIAFLVLKQSKNDEKYFYLFLTLLITFAYSFIAFPNKKFSSFFLLSVVAGVALIGANRNEKYLFNVRFAKLKWGLLILILVGGTTSYIKLKSELHFGEAIYLKEREQYPLMLNKLQNISELFYPFDASKQPVDYYRGIANSYMGNYKWSLEDNLSGLTLAPFSPIIMSNLGSSYYSLKNYKKATDQFLLVTKYFPNYLHPQISLLDLYFESGQNEKAKSLFDGLIIKAPNNPHLLLYKKKFNLE